MRIRKNFLSIVFGLVLFLPLASVLVTSSTVSFPIPIIYQSPTLDGVISASEYQFNSSFSNGDFQVFWTISSDEIFFGIKGNALGYISLGFEPSFMMKDADMILGFVFPNTTVSIVDAFSTGNVGPHPPDTSLGGTDDLIAYNGSEDISSTTIEFQRKLITGDVYDTDLPTDQSIDIIWAISNTDDFDAGHTARGSGTIDLNQGGSTDTTPPPLWIYHAVLMILGFLAMLSAIIIARFLKHKKWRLKVHRRVNLFASVSSIAGTIISFIMVADHFRIAHHFLGVIAIPLLVFMPIIGYIFIRNLENVPILKVLNPYRKKLRVIHRWMGYVTFILLTSNIILGLVRVFG